MQVQEAVEKEWDTFKAERTAGIEEISRLRERVAEESRQKAARREGENDDAKMAVEGEADDKQASRESRSGDMGMDVDDAVEKEGGVKDEKKADVTPPGPGYDDDAVEY